MALLASIAFRNAFRRLARLTDELRKADPSVVTAKFVSFFRTLGTNFEV